MNMEKETEGDALLVHEHIGFFNNNQNPLDKKGNEYNRLNYIIDDYETLQTFFDALMGNTSFKGELSVESNKFDDNIGYKIAKIISNNSITKLKIGNRNKPFSDRIAKAIGDSLENNTTLTHLDIFLNIETLSPLHMCKFLKNPKSNLKFFSSLKLNKELFEYLSKYLNKDSKLNKISFYFEPLIYVDLLYTPPIERELYHQLADKIQNDSNIYMLDVIPLFENFETGINQKLISFVDELHQTLKFSCDINLKEFKEKIDIESIYQEENKKMGVIIEKLDLLKQSNVRNSIVSVRSYLNRTIGELLNNALYDLEISRERNPNNEELFTAQGSIKFIAQFLINNQK